MSLLQLKSIEYNGTGEDIDATEFCTIAHEAVDLKLGVFSIFTTVLLYVIPLVAFPIFYSKWVYFKRQLLYHFELIQLLSPKDAFLISIFVNILFFLGFGKPWRKAKSFSNLRLKLQGDYEIEIKTLSDYKVGIW